MKVLSVLVFIFTIAVQVSILILTQWKITMIEYWLFIMPIGLCGGCATFFIWKRDKP